MTKNLSIFGHKQHFLTTEVILGCIINPCVSSGRPEVRCQENQGNKSLMIAGQKFKTVILCTAPRVSQSNFPQLMLWMVRVIAIIAVCTSFAPEETWCADFSEYGGQSELWRDSLESWEKNTQSPVQNGWRSHKKRWQEEEAFCQRKLKNRKHKRRNVLTEADLINAHDNSSCQWLLLVVICQDMSFFIVLTWRKWMKDINLAFSKIRKISVGAEAVTPHLCVEPIHCRNPFLSPLFWDGPTSTRSDHLSHSF